MAKHGRHVKQRKRFKKFDKLYFTTRSKSISKHKSRVRK